MQVQTLLNCIPILILKTTYIILSAVFKKLLSCQRQIFLGNFRTRTQSLDTKRMKSLLMVAVKQKYDTDIYI